MEDRCVMCGEVIPEGRWVCPICEHKINEDHHKAEVEREYQFVQLMNPCIPNRVNPGVINELKRMGFFKAPASVQHHGAYTGALFDHSYAVTKALLHLTKCLDLKWGTPESPYIVGMFHDLCKCDNYITSDDEAWEYNNATLLPGHGEKSVIMAQQLISLTEEEMLCIRWHMGFADDQKNWNSYGRSVTEFNNVLYTHTADMIAARILGV